MEICVLPGGYLDADGMCHREAALCALRGCDEEALRSIPAGATEIRAVSEVLSVVVRTIGLHRMTTEIAGALTPADRDYLLVRLWQLSFSSRVDLVLECPDLSCGARMDLDFEIAAIAPEVRPLQPSHSASIAGHAVVFRVPLASDVESVILSLSSDPLTALIARCVRSIDGRVDDIEEQVSALPIEVRSALVTEIERVCPRLDAEFEAECPECGARFEALYDPSAQLVAALDRGGPRLEHDVHLLSFHYHWPLSEILEMAGPVRRRFVRILTRELGDISRSGVQ
jgi:hypothetical protein